MDMMDMDQIHMDGGTRYSLRLDQQERLINLGRTKLEYALAHATYWAMVKKWDKVEVVDSVSKEVVFVAVRWNKH